MPPGHSADFLMGFDSCLQSSRTNSLSPGLAMSAWIITAGTSQFMSVVPVALISPEHVLCSITQWCSAMCLKSPHSMSWAQFTSSNPAHLFFKLSWTLILHYFSFALEYSFSSLSCLGHLDFFHSHLHSLFLCIHILPSKTPMLDPWHDVFIIFFMTSWIERHRFVST